MMRGRNALPRVAALLGGAVVVCAAIVLSQRTGLAAHAPMSRISLLQMLEEEKEQLAGLGPEVIRVSTSASLAWQNALRTRRQAAFMVRWRKRACLRASSKHAKSAAPRVAQLW